MPSDEKYRVWECKLYVPADVELPLAADSPMRRGVTATFQKMMGADDIGYDIFSGWGGSVDECEMAVIENREPRIDEVELNNAIDWKERALTAERERSYWRHIARKRQRDKNALVAHMEQIKAAYETHAVPDESLVLIGRVLRQQPTTSLARLIAKKQAEAYTKALDEMRLALRDCRTVQALDVAISAIHELRQQAEEGDNND